MKKIIILSAVFLNLLTTSCIDSLLNKEPENEYSTGNFYKTPEHIKAGTMACYTQLQSVMSTNFAYWGEGRADNVAIKHAGETTSLHDNNLNSDLATADWTSLYTLISRTNYVIKYAPNVFEPTDKQGNQYIGEAKALRALAYFYLVRIWGDVPLISEPYTSPDAEVFVTRSDKEAVLDFIIEDLKFAANNCAESNERTMFNQTGAIGLLTQVYMWRHNYDEAIKCANEILANNQYSLVNRMEDWGKMFSENNASESIFEVGYDETRTNGLRTLYALGSDADYTPSTKFKESFEPGDLRQEYIYDPTTDNPYIWKFLGKGVDDEVSTPSMQNIILIRLADIMLLKAEALAQKGGEANIKEALQLMEPIRKRAGLTPALLTEEEAISLYGSIEDAILHERSIELCYEGHRWFDLVRTGKAISTMQPINGLNDPNNLLWPISTETINRNPNIEQNEYYK